MDGRDRANRKPVHQYVLLLVILRANIRRLVPRDHMLLDRDVSVDVNVDCEVHLDVDVDIVVEADV